MFLGYYTCVEVIFTLRRQVGFYMMGVYAPTLLIVVLTWLSFWINPDASAARVPLGEFLKYTHIKSIFNNTQWRAVAGPGVVGERVYIIFMKSLTTYGRRREVQIDSTRLHE